MDSCIDLCSDHIIYCFEKCKNEYQPMSQDYSRCIIQCNELLGICNDNCLEVPSDSLLYMYKCISENGCGSYPSFDEKCLVDNKKKIASCYSDFCSMLNKEKCIEDSDVLIKKLLYKPIEKVIQNDTKKAKQKPTNMFIIFLVIIFLVMLVMKK